MKTIEFSEIIETLTPVKLSETHEPGVNEEVDTAFNNIFSKLFDDILFRECGERAPQVKLIAASRYLVPAIVVCSLGEERSVRSETTIYEGKGADQRGVDPEEYCKQIQVDYSKVEPRDNKIEDAIPGADRVFRCSDCDGEGDVQCSECGGRGRLRCSRCDGEGKIPCPECDGQGRYKCWSCFGTGKQNSKKCSRCYGRGHIKCTHCNPPYHRVRCPRCGGSGKVRCDECKGKGRVVCSKCEGHGYFIKRYFFIISHHAHYAYRTYFPADEFSSFSMLHGNIRITSAENPAKSLSIFAISAYSKRERFIPYMSHTAYNNSPTFAKEVQALAKESKAEADAYNFGTVAQFVDAFVIDCYKIRYLIEWPHTSNTKTELTDELTSDPSTRREYEIIIDAKGEYYYSESDPMRELAKEIYEKNIAAFHYPFLKRNFYTACVNLLQSKFMPFFERENFLNKDSLMRKIYFYRSYHRLFLIPYSVAAALLTHALIKDYTSLGEFFLFNKTLTLISSVLVGFYLPRSHKYNHMMPSSPIFSSFVSFLRHVKFGILELVFLLISNVSFISSLIVCYLANKDSIEKRLKI